MWWFTSAIPTLQEVEAKGSEIQGHTQLHNEVETSLAIEGKLMDTQTDRAPKLSMALRYIVQWYRVYLLCTKSQDHSPAPEWRAATATGTGSMMGHELDHHVQGSS